jgi:hypothetical protein
MSESNSGFDSTSSGDVEAAHPAAGAVVFGYANGAYAWSAEDWAKFPEQRHAVIVVYIPGENIVDVEGDILDVEAGYLAAGSPNRPDALSQASQWAQRKRRQEQIPGAYSSLSAIEDLVTVMGNDTGLFVGDWTGQEHEDSVPNDANVIATQYGSPSRPAPGEGHWDLSEIDNGRFDAWYQHNHPSAAPAPGPAPGAPPDHSGGFDMASLPTLSQNNPGENVVNESVRAAQALLNLRLNAGLTTDGRFGPHTAGAVVNLEHSHGLSVDSGVIGPQVWGALLA